MATIQDIADEVGISKAAVSRILNHKGSFNPETIRKVERAAKRLNYKTIHMLKQENETEGKTIALIFPPSDSPYYGIYTMLIEQAAYSYGYDLLLCTSLFKEKSEEESLWELKNKNVSGILLGNFVKDTALLTKLDIPVGTVGFKADDAICSVTPDNDSCGHIAARHLTGRGCRNLLYLTRFPEGLKYDLRYKGFLEEARKRGANVWPYQVGIEMDMQRDVPGIITEMSMKHPEADGVFSETFRLAAMFYRTYTDLGYRVPQDIKIVGYGNAYMASYSSPRLTIVRENTSQMAEQAVATLVDRIENGPSENLDRENEIHIPVSLEVGQTT